MNTDLQDDPYRSLAALVRKAGGFQKSSKPFAEVRAITHIQMHVFRFHEQMHESRSAWLSLPTPRASPQCTRMPHTHFYTHTHIHTQFMWANFLRPRVPLVLESPGTVVNFSAPLAMHAL